MSPSDFIIDVNETDFEYQVLAYSQQVPVVVDFWAEWCKPCKVLGPLLERLAQEAQGEFRLAKVNVDDNPNLAIRYGVRSIPVVKAFRDGQMIAELIGVQPEPRLREFLHSIAPSESDLLVEKGSSQLSLLRSTQAEQTFRQVLENTPANSAAMLGLAKSLLQQGKGKESLLILSEFPTSREYKSAEVLLPLARSLDEYERAQDNQSEDPLDAAFNQSIRLVKRGNLEAAMDGLLDILRENKRYRDGKARQVMLGLLEILGGDSDIARQYRQELATVLF